MRALTRQLDRACSPFALVEQFGPGEGVVLLRSGAVGGGPARYSLVAARPFLVFRSFASSCQLRWAGRTDWRFGDPWRMLEDLIGRYELPDEIDWALPLGGCFGFWGYDLKNFIEPRLPRRTVDDLGIPDCHLGFYDSLVLFDQRLGTSTVISTGLEADGSRSIARARSQLDFWLQRLANGDVEGDSPPNPARPETIAPRLSSRPEALLQDSPAVFSDTTPTHYVAQVRRAQALIRAGDIYQVNLAHRLSARIGVSGWGLFQALTEVSPAPYEAYFDAGEFQLVCASPELFLRLSGSQIRTRPIKGTRPRSLDPDQDARLSYQLQTSPKEMAELVMITDLLRNDLGKVCEFGSVHVDELARLERFAQVQHLVSTVEGSLRRDVSHLGALSACFPGGSITGAPKVRAMEIIDELEPVRRGPYTGALGYIGFNRETQLAMTIRTALVFEGLAHFHTGAGIVADSDPESEYQETLAKAAGFLAALPLCHRPHDGIPQRKTGS